MSSQILYAHDMRTDLYMLIFNLEVVSNNAHTCIAFVKFSCKAPKNMKSSHANPFAMHNLLDGRESLNQLFIVSHMYERLLNLDELQ